MAVAVALGLGLCRLPLLEFDERLTELADKHCQHMADEGFIGHVSLDGLSPFHRYFNGGCQDHIEENVFGTNTGEVCWSPSPFPPSPHPSVFVFMVVFIVLLTPVVCTFRAKCTTCRSRPCPRLCWTPTPTS